MTVRSFPYTSIHEQSLLRGPDKTWKFDGMYSSKDALSFILYSLFSSLYFLKHFRRKIICFHPPEAPLRKYPGKFHPMCPPQRNIHPPRSNPVPSQFLNSHRVDPVRKTLNPVKNLARHRLLGYWYRGVYIGGIGIGSRLTFDT